jgi:CCR4-NOT transcription complex subunit 7/8
MAADARIRDVWAHNLNEEFATIRRVLLRYPYVGMDTEFPGVVARPSATFRTPAEFQYAMVKMNVDLLRVIQIGLTFSDENGNFPVDAPCTWQFHFAFSLESDAYAEDSIALLQEAGINFSRHSRDGIRVEDFGELLMSSGLVIDNRVKWVSFHSYYDFGYLLRICTCVPLPESDRDFFASLQRFFPCIYDIKHLIHTFDDLHGGLGNIATQLGLERIHGPAHQAGSDSLLTSSVFYAVRNRYFGGVIDDARFMGVLFGLDGRRQGQAD